MVSLGVLTAHVAAFLLVWFLVILAGLGMRQIFRLNLGRSAVPLLGLVYWAVILYLLPFRGGLDLAIALAFLGGGLALLSSWRAHQQFKPVDIIATILLAVGLLSYTSIFSVNYVPMGDDAAMVGASIRMIEMHGGYPAAYVPWFPDLMFPKVNLALPTLGAAAVHLGAAPASAAVVLAPLSYGLWLLSIHALLRYWVAPRPAAILALVSVWGSRWAQNTISWGGYPTIAGVCAGVFATRMLLEFRNDTTWRTRVATGLSIAAIPLVHGVSAAVWLYSLGSVTALVVLLGASRRLQTLTAMITAALVAAVVLVIYLVPNYLPITPELEDYTRRHILVDAPPHGRFPEIIVDALEYLGKYGGEPVTTLALLGLAGLILTRQWREVGLMLGLFGLTAFLILNVHYWILPASYLLYTNRIVYWLAPLAALTMALAWRRVSFWPWYRGVLVGLVVLLVGYAGMNHFQQFQVHSLKPTVKQDQWESLIWMRDHLPEEGVVQGPTSSSAHLIPLVANHGCTAWQMHHFVKDHRERIFARLKPKYVYREIGFDQPVPIGAIVRFQNPSVTIWECP